MLLGRSSSNMEFKHGWSCFLTVFVVIFDFEVGVPGLYYTANLCSEIAVKVQWKDCNLVWSTVSHCMQWLTVIIWITYLQLLQSLNSNPFFGGRIAKIASKQCNTTVAFACCNIWKWRSSIIAVAWLQFRLQWKNC